jgi:hypothetical protein
METAESFEVRNAPSSYPPGPGQVPAVGQPQDSERPFAVCTSLPLEACLRRSTRPLRPLKGEAPAFAWASNHAVSDMKEGGSARSTWTSR